MAESTKKMKTDSKSKKPRNKGGVLGLMSKRRWFIVVVFLSSLTWSYTAGPPLSESYISNRYFVNPNRWDYETGALLGNKDLIFEIFEPKYWTATWIWQAGAYFEWIEGPTWFNNKLYFSDTITNRIYSYSDYQGTQIEMINSGDATDDQISKLYEPGSNGLLKDPRNSDCLLIAQHASHRIISYNIKTQKKEVIASDYNGKKLNSPNDMVLDSKNEYLYFTDPPYGLQTKKEHSQSGSISLRTETYADRLSELGFSGIYRIKLDKSNNNNKVELIDKSMKRPNGISISKVNGQTRLYVSESILNEFSVNMYEIDNNGVKFMETWNTKTIQSHLKGGSSELMIGNNEELNGQSDGIAVHPSMNYLFATCPENKLCIINETNGQLEAAVKFADGVKLSNLVFADDNCLYLTANGNLWQLELNHNNLPF